MTDYLLVNFGGPRDVGEVLPFLTELLTDRDVIQTGLPRWIQNKLFQRIARKRTPKIQEDYHSIGGKSPIYFDTEIIGKKLSELLQKPVLTFHRYLPATHEASLRQIEQSTADTIQVIPLFPQFCYATTGSIARFLSIRLSQKTVRKLRWIKSYAAHPAFVEAHKRKIAQFLKVHDLAEDEIALLFSAHGVPRAFIDQGDVYQSECELSFKTISAGFPKAPGHLSYQSKFGRGEWVRPYTDETCGEIRGWNQERKTIVVIPLSFTSDHIETLFEIEQLYLPPMRAQGFKAFRCPALNLEPYWIEALAEIARETNLCNTQMLYRK